MWSLHQPIDEILKRLIAAERNRDFTYGHIGATTSTDRIPGFVLDQYRVVLGRGEPVFDSACAALKSWQHFPRDWTCIFPNDAPIIAGTTVALVVHALGIWWINTCRIVYLVDDRVGLVRRCGFAYGTLPAHVERGEERFTIEMDADETVSYVLRAYSRPRILMARLGYPIARRLQKRFARDSQTAVVNYVSNALLKSEIEPFDASHRDAKRP